jgi:hypothetical protein
VKRQRSRHETTLFIPYFRKERISFATKPIEIADGIFKELVPSEGRNSDLCEWLHIILLPPSVGIVDQGHSETGMLSDPTGKVCGCILSLIEFSFPCIYIGAPIPEFSG